MKVFVVQWREGSFEKNPEPSVEHGIEEVFLSEDAARTYITAVGNDGFYRYIETYETDDPD